MYKPQALDVDGSSVEIVKFRDFLQQRAKEENSPLQHVPPEHIPLIAKLAHERCDNCD